MFEKKTKFATTGLNFELKRELMSELKSELKHDIETVCRNLVIELFGDMRDERYISTRIWPGLTAKTLGGELKERMITAAVAKFDEIYEEKTKEIIAGEEFIDSVVERIRRKQLIGN